MPAYSIPLDAICMATYMRPNASTYGHHYHHHYHQHHSYLWLVHMATAVLVHPCILLGTDCCFTMLMLLCSWATDRSWRHPTSAPQLTPYCHWKNVLKMRTLTLTRKCKSSGNWHAMRWVTRHRPLWPCSLYCCTEETLLCLDAWLKDTIVSISQTAALQRLGVRGMGWFQEGIVC